MKRQSTFFLFMGVVAVIALIGLLAQARGDEPTPAQDQPPVVENGSDSTGGQPADTPSDQPPADGEQESDGSGNGAGGEAKPADETTPQDPPSAESTNTETPKSEPGVDAALEGLGDVLGETLKTLKEVQSTLQDAPTPAGSNAANETGPSDQSSLLDTFKNLDRLKKEVQHELDIQRSVADDRVLQDVNEAISMAEAQLSRRTRSSVNVTLNRKAEELRRLTNELKELNDLLGAQEVTPAEGAGNK